MLHKVFKKIIEGGDEKMLLDNEQLVSLYGILSCYKNKPLDDWVWLYAKPLAVTDATLSKQEIFQLLAISQQKFQQSTVSGR